MTILTRDLYVRAFQFKSRAVVIEMSGAPIFWGVARGAIRPQTALMRVVEPMTREAILRRRL